MISQVSKVGFPIRKSTDQRVFAPPRSLSQRITSFIACACQGIHQLPLRHLIILIANTHPDRSERNWQKRPASRDLSDGAVRQPIICRGLSVHGDGPHSSAPGRLRKVMGLPGPDSERGTRTNLLFTMSCRTGGGPKPAANLFSLRVTSHPLDTDWWSRTGSNRRHPACKAGALPAELRPLIIDEGNGGPGRT